MRFLIRILQVHVAPRARRVTAPTRNGANASHVHPVVRLAPQWVALVALRAGAWTKKGYARPRVAATATRASIMRTANARSVTRLAKLVPAPQKITAYPVRIRYCFKASAACPSATTRITPWYNLPDRFASLVCILAKVASPVWTARHVKMGYNCKAENADRPARRGKTKEFIVTILNRSMVE